MGNCEIMVFAPHPDDEALGCAGLIYKALQRKKKVKVVVIANGESSVDGTEWFYGRKPTTQDFINIGYVRQKETISAMKILGLESDDVIFLGYPNDGLMEIISSDIYTKDNPFRSEFTNFERVSYENSRSVGATFCKESLKSDIKDILEEGKPRYVYVTHPMDSHFDHRACGKYIPSISKEFDKSINILSYFISKSKIPSPKRRFIYKCTGQLREKYLDKTSRKFKEQCINQYKSQSYLFDQLAFHYEVERFWKLEHGFRIKIAKKFIPNLRY
ncbi:MAG: PIG-L family deacetylase [Thermoplasmata archaeon]|nr:MAG: PIG-L family deacetylase [Thermoplasmata archaeon]